MLDKITSSLARAVQVVDARQPVAVNNARVSRSGPASVPTRRRRLSGFEARALDPRLFIDAVFGVPYPGNPRQKCDLKLTTPAGDLFMEGSSQHLRI
jgi:hypothetical protein